MRLRTLSPLRLCIWLTQLRFALAADTVDPDDSVLSVREFLPILASGQGNEGERELFFPATSLRGPLAGSFFGDGVREDHSSRFRGTPASPSLPALEVFSWDFGGRSFPRSPIYIACLRDVVMVSFRGGFRGLMLPSAVESMSLLNFWGLAGTLFCIGFGGTPFLPTKTGRGFRIASLVEMMRMVGSENGRLKIRKTFEPSFPVFCGVFPLRLGWVVSSYHVFPAG